MKLGWTLALLGGAAAVAFAAFKMTGGSTTTASTATPGCVSLSSGGANQAPIVAGGTATFCAPAGATSVTVTATNPFAQAATITSSVVGNRVTFSSPAGTATGMNATYTIQWNTSATTTASANVTLTTA